MRRCASVGTPCPPPKIKRPVILPRHQFARIVIIATHTRLLHACLQDTLVELREKVWLIKGCQTIKHALRDCIVCRLRRLQRERAPIAPLPRESIKDVNPVPLSELTSSDIHAFDQPHLHRPRHTSLFSPARLLAPYTWSLRMISSPPFSCWHSTVSFRAA